MAFLKARNHLKAKNFRLDSQTESFVVGLNHGVVLFRRLAEILIKYYRKTNDDIKFTNMLSNVDLILILANTKKTSPQCCVCGEGGPPVTE